MTIALSLTGPSAFAQARDPAAAEAQFQAGKAAMERGATAEACGRFEESQRLDPAPGTLFFWADCEEKRGRSATAWALFRELLQKMPDSDPRRATVVDRANTLEPRVPRLVLRMGPDVPKDATIKRGDIVVGRASLGTPIPVDPGGHVITVEAPGRKPSRTETKVAEGETRELVLVPGPVDHARKASIATSPPSQEQEPHVGPQAAAGFAVGTLGAGGIVAGIVVGVIAKVSYDESDDHCDHDDFCDDEGIAIREDARAQGTIATVLFSVGAATWATGLVVLLTAPKGEGGLASRAPIHVGFGPGSVVVRGSW